MDKRIIQLFVVVFVLSFTNAQPVAVWPPATNLKYSQSGTASAFAQNANGTWSGFSSSQPRVTDKGLLLEPAVTNQCFNYNAKPVDTSGIIISTNNASAIRVVSDTSSLIAGGFGPAIASGFMNGNVFEFDYLGKYVTFTLGNTTTVGNYVYSMWARKVSGPADTPTAGIKMGLLINGSSTEIYTNSSSWTRIAGISNATKPGSIFYVRTDKGVVARFILNQLELVTDYNKGTPSNPVVTEGGYATHGPDVATFSIPSDSSRNTVMITPFGNPVIFRPRPSNNQLTLQSVYPEPWYGQYILNVSIISENDAELPYTTQSLFSTTSYFDRWRNVVMDRSNLQQTFRDDFTKLDISSNQHDSTTWFTDPTHYTLGDAYVATLATNPGSYQIVNNTLFQCRGQLNTTDNRYYTCNIQTSNSSGNGFQQAYGVWETRAKVPNVNGAWPAFWPYSIYRYTNSTSPHGEWDIFEFYPDNDTSKKQMHCTLNLWQMMNSSRNVTEVPDGHMQNGNIVTLDYDTTLDYHVYGGEITPDWTIFYADYKEVTRIRTFREWTVPMYITVGMSLSPGYGQPQMDFYVDYVAVYERTSTTSSTSSSTTATSSTSASSSSSTKTSTTSGADSTSQSSSSTPPSTSASSTSSPSTSLSTSSPTSDSTTSPEPTNSGDYIYSHFTSLTICCLVYLIL